MKKNDIVELKCIDISFKGFGICKIDNFVVFVKDMLIDEIGKVKIISLKKNYAFGIIDELLVTSEYRVEPKCKLSYKCGGCDYQYIEYNRQLELKKKIVDDYLKNTELNVRVDNIIGADKPYGYRNKVQIPVIDNEFGFYRKHSNDIVSCDYCYLQTELENKIFLKTKELILKYNIGPYVRHILIKHSSLNEVMLCLIVTSFSLNGLNEISNELTNEFKEIKSLMLNLNNFNNNVILGTEEKVLFGNNYIYDEFDGIKEKISLKSFYQVNHDQMIKLYSTALNKANLNKDMSVLDLYCGIGTIGLYASKYVNNVTGVEVVPEAIENAKENAELNKIDNIEFYCDDAYNIDKYIKDKDLVIVDPPRKGLDERVVISLLQNSSSQILYISCNYETMVRDLLHLKDAYDLSNITLVDMFPNTRHVEAIASLVKKS